MIVQCETCRTKFNIDETLLNKEGSKVRCSRCENIFVAYPEEHNEAEDLLDVSAEQQEMEAEKEAVGAGFDDDNRFEEDAMEDIGDLEAEYGEDSSDFLEEGDVQKIASKDDKEKAEETSKDVDEAIEHVSDRKKGGKSRNLLIFIAIILLLAGAGAYVYFQTPHLISGFLALSTKPAEIQKSSDMGARRLEILTVDGSFVDSEKAGRFFVICGKLRNNYPKRRNSILVKGSLLNESGQVVKEKSAYAGNTFKEEDLPSLPLEEINRLMQNRHGIENKNVNIDPGTSIDFEIVFEDLPENLSEFTVGAVSSSPGKPETNNKPEGSETTL